MKYSHFFLFELLKHVVCLMIKEKFKVKGSSVYQDATSWQSYRGLPVSFDLQLITMKMGVHERQTNEYIIWQVDRACLCK